MRGLAAAATRKASSSAESAAGSGADNALLTALQRRLKPSGGGSAPKKEHLAVTLLLTRNRAIEPRTIWKQHGVSGSGGTRRRIIAWRDRIIEEDLINILGQQQPVEQLPAERVPVQLLVQESL